MTVRTMDNNNSECVTHRTIIKVFTQWQNGNNVTTENPLTDTIVPRGLEQNPFLMYYTPLLVSTGVLSNSLCSVLLLNSILRKFSSSHYLCSIVLLNTAYLLMLLMKWLTILGYNVYHRPVVCHVVDWLTNLSSFLSLWLAVAFCVDRYIAICWPQESPKMCTPTRARVVVVCFVVAAITIYLNISLTVGVVIIDGQPKCIELPIYFSKTKELKVLDLFVNHLLPYLVIMTLLCLMGRTVYWQQRGLNLWQTDHAQIRQTTFVYFGVFLMAQIPADCLRMVTFITSNLQQDFNAKKLGGSFHSWQLIAAYMSHTGMALNFIILLSTYQLFRQCFLDVFKVKSICYDRSRNTLPECIELKLSANDKNENQTPILNT